MNIGQYDIVLVNLDPTIGSEIRKTRPCVVLSPDEMNRHLRTVVMAPVARSDKDYLPAFGLNNPRTPDALPSTRSARSTGNGWSAASAR